VSSGLETLYSCHVQGSTPRSWSIAASGLCSSPAGRSRISPLELGLPSETLRKKVRQAEADQGLRPDMPSTAEREQIKDLKRENAELRRANEILPAASLFFASELDESRPK
jgi:transposase-like protein